jgi:hypothetical protein
MEDTPVRIRAATLVEILIVAAVLVTLTAILVPVISRAKVAGERSVAISNTRQIAQAVMVYASSNDDMIPARSFTSSGYWMSQIGLVSGGRATLIDPKFEYEKGLSTPDIYATLAGYALNACLRPERSYQSLSDQGRTVLVGPVAYWSVKDPGATHHLPYVWIGQPDDRIDAWIRRLHPNGTVTVHGGLGSKRYFEKGIYAFLDGHAKTVASTGFYEPEPDPCGWKELPTNLDDGLRPTFAVRSTRTSLPQ